MNQIATERSTWTTSAARKEVLQREDVLDARRARKDQQDGEQAGADQRQETQP
jgi:hypothetical protein